MANTYNLVLEGDDQDNILKAHMENKKNGGFNYYTIVHGAGGNDKLSVASLTGYDKGVELYGDEGNDTLADSEESDTLSGGLGDDTITAMQGKDVIDGGEGDDTLRTEGNLSRLTITGIEHLEVRGLLRVAGPELDLFASIEMSPGGSITFHDAANFDGHNVIGDRIALTGSVYDDILDLSTATASLVAEGGNGDDHLLAGSGNALLDGGYGNDEIDGGIGRDELNGSNGDDTVHGGDGNDLIIAEIGNDWVMGGAGNDKISGETIYDYDNHPIRSTGNKVFDGGTGNDLFENLDHLTDFNVTLTGGKGNDTLEFHGNTANMSVESIETLVLTVKWSEPNFLLSQPLEASAEFLESFKHIVSATNNPDITPEIHLTSADNFHWRDADTRMSGEMWGTSHSDKIDMSKARMYWTINGGSGNDVLIAGAGGEISGDDGSDTIIGGSGGDDISGGAGNDVINGRGGKDELGGGDGKDIFIFQAGSGVDYIYHFDLSGSSKDRIDLSAVKSIKDYNDLINHHIDEKSGGLYIEFSDKDRLWLDHVTKDALDSSLFIF